MRYLIFLFAFSRALAQDTGVHAPPITGTYAYNTFKPGAAGFPALGASYIDPVFGSSVRRITDVGANINYDQNYSFHNINADATLSFHNLQNSFDMISIVDGKTVYSGQPMGLFVSDNRWDMLDPDKYYYFSGADLVRRNLAAQTNTVMKTFPATLQVLGSSANYQTADGRYFLVRYSNAIHIWDSQTNTIFAGSVTEDFITSGGWAGITPSGKNIITQTGPTPQPQQEHHAYPVNLAGQSISASFVQFFGLCGDHGVPMSASDGKDYVVTLNCYNHAQVYRCDVTVDVTGFTPAQQEAAQTKLLDITFNDAGHFSAVSVGALKDWVFFTPEAIGNDAFDQAPSSWYAYKQEVIAINVLSGQYRRLAHHRSRGMSASGYPTFPRVSSSPKGDVVLWTSDFNNSTPAQYADMYIIVNPLASTYHPVKFALLVTMTSSTPVSAGVPVPQFDTFDACDMAGKAKINSLANPVTLREGQKYSYQCLQVQGAANDLAYEKAA